MTYITLGAAAWAVVVVYVIVAGCVARVFRSIHPKIQPSLKPVPPYISWPDGMNPEGYTDCTNMAREPTKTRPGRKCYGPTEYSSPASHMMCERCKEYVKVKDEISERKKLVTKIAKENKEIEKTVKKYNESHKELQIGAFLWPIYVPVYVLKTLFILLSGNEDTLKIDVA